MSGFDRIMARRLRHDAEGTGLVSFVLVIPFFLVVFLAVIEFALAMHQWSLATEAAHVGARLAVVSNPVAVSNLAKYAPFSIRANGHKIISALRIIVIL